jgi:hypothetical protein
MWAPINIANCDLDRFGLVAFLDWAASRFCETTSWKSGKLDVQLGPKLQCWPQTSGEEVRTIQSLAVHHRRRRRASSAFRYLASW